MHNGAAPGRDAQIPLDAPAFAMADPTSTTSSNDGIAQLRAMSTTAGLTAPGADTYRAVNPFAVASVVAGVLSLAGLLHPVFLIIPVLGVIFALIGGVQILRSRGTQAGLILLIAGLLLCTLAGGYLIQQELLARQRQTLYVDELQDWADQWGQALVEGRYADAHAMMSDGFRLNTPLERFATSFSDMNEGRFGTLTSVSTNRLVDIEQDTDGRAGARGVLTFRFDTTGDSPDNVVKQIAYFARQPSAEGEDGMAWVATSFEEWFK